MHIVTFGWFEKLLFSGNWSIEALNHAFLQPFSTNSNQSERRCWL